jgi:glucuronokinase
MVYMDFSQAQEHRSGGLPHYYYESMPPALLPNIFVAYTTTLSEPTEIFHNDIRSRYNRGDQAIVSAMAHFATLAEQGREALLAGDTKRLGVLINENFDTRCRFYQLPSWQVQMVEGARACGASAKFAGSGGAIIGVYEDEEIYQKLCVQMERIGSKVIKPQVWSE